MTTKPKIKARYEFTGTSRSSDLDKYSKKLMESGKSFTTIDSGGNFEIIYEDGVVYKHKDNGVRYEYSYINKMIIGEVRRRIESKEYIPKNTNFERVGIDTVLYNVEAIKAACKSKVECVAIDISACYFTTAKMLGVISEEIYNRIMLKNNNTKDFKVALSSAIGSLGNIKIKKTYVKGRIKDVKMLRNELNVARLDVIDKVWSNSMKIINAVPSGFLMFLTDCYYVLPEHAELVCNMLSDMGYKYKSEKVTFDVLKVTYAGGSPIYRVDFIKESNLEKFRKGERESEKSYVSFGVKNTWKGRENY